MDESKKWVIREAEIIGDQMETVRRRILSNGSEKPMLDKMFLQDVEVSLAKYLGVLEACIETFNEEV